jgi:predicted oxidoreductase
VTIGPDEERLMNNGQFFLWFGNTIEELANKAGIHPSSLKETVETYNTYADQGKDLEFGRPGKYLKEITKPPFVAQQNWLMTLHNSGGLRVNIQLQILDVNGDVIPGLYGAGEVIGGISGEIYLTTTHYPAAMTFGYLAGKKFVVQELG